MKDVPGNLLLAKDTEFAVEIRLRFDSVSSTLCDGDELTKLALVAGWCDQSALEGFVRATQHDVWRLSLTWRVSVWLMT